MGGTTIEQMILYQRNRDKDKDRGKPLKFQTETKTETNKARQTRLDKIGALRNCYVVAPSRTRTGLSKD